MHSGGIIVFEVHTEICFQVSSDIQDHSKLDEQPYIVLSEELRDGFLALARVTFQCHYQILFAYLFLPVRNRVQTTINN